MWIRRMAVGALALSAACSSLAPGNVSGAVDMVVVTYDPSAGKYVLKTEQLTTLKKLRTLEGEAAQIDLGAKVSVDLAAMTQANPQTTAAITSQVITSAGASADFDYFESEGVVHPADADALALATTYYNFESAQLLFAGLGVTLPAARVAYDPVISGKLAAQLSPLTDSVLSQPYLRSFVVPQATSTNDLPPGMQLGVVGHQYAHAVFQSQFYTGEAYPWLEAKMGSQANAYRATDNLVRSIDEGIADYFGAVIADDPTFVRTAPGKPDEDRRLDPAKPRCAPADLVTKMQQQSREQYNPYILGSVISGLLWELTVARDDLSHEIQESVVKWEKDLGTRVLTHTVAQTLPDALDSLASTLNESLKVRACGLIFDRFRMTKADVPSCNVVVRTPEQKCAF